MITRLNAALARLRTAAGDIGTIRDSLLELHERLPASPREMSADDLDTELDVRTELRSVIACVLRDFLEPAARHLLAAIDSSSTARSPAKGGMFPAGLDLHSDSEETRQALYDLVVRDNFTPQRDEAPDDVWVPPYTPEQAGLRVYCEHGRWFATWLKLEEPESLKEAERRELLVLTEAADEPGRLVYRGV
ncbi:MAG TPA: hypothetical protein VE685_00890 [Thermoanaerobaculia bacterium]|nr:hypothetical protein [Thermoanaerobaculia bacterium]